MWTAGTGVSPAPRTDAQVIVGLTPRCYCKMPPDSSAVFRRRLTSSPEPPPSVRTERISERCAATRLTAPSATRLPHHIGQHMNLARARHDLRLHDPIVANCRNLRQDFEALSRVAIKLGNIGCNCVTPKCVPEGRLLVGW